jgi:signal transduction histidine kinase
VPARLGRTEETIETVIVSKLLDEVISSLCPPSTFIIDIPIHLPTLRTRRLLLYQVFSNLIGNSIKHHNRLDGWIQISVEESDNFYKFTISDDGVGIAPEYQANIFTIFQAVNPQNRSDSTGIGLAIVKKIIQSEGGEIWLESQVDCGTKFYFTWPKVTRN